MNYYIGYIFYIEAMAVILSMLKSKTVAKKGAGDGQAESTVLKRPIKIGVGLVDPRTCTSRYM